MDTLPDTARADEPRTKPRRRWRWLLGVGIFLGVLAGGALVGYRPLARWWIEREARAKGVALGFDDFSLASDRVVLKGARFRLVGVEGVDMTAATIGVDVKGLDPLRVDAKALVVSIDGPVAERLDALTVWADKHADTLNLPASGDVSLAWGAKASPWLTLKGSASSDGKGGGKFEGEVGLEGANLGLVSSRWSKKEPIVLGLGARLPEEAKVRVVFDPRAEPMKAVVTLAPVKVDDLAKARGMAVPEALMGASAEGTATIFVGAPEAKGMYTGTASIDVTGFIPPHPRELDGIVFGRKTKLGATFEVTPDLGEMRIGKATVEAGAFKLAGKGNVTRKGWTARALMDLSGQVPCSELGASAVGSHVGGLVGDFLQGVARVGLGGAVTVRVKVDADTSAIEKAKVDQAVEIGCRLGR